MGCCFLKGEDFCSLHHQFPGNWSQVNIMQEGYLKRLSRGNWFSVGKSSIGLVFGLSDQIRSVAQSCLTLCGPMNRSTPGLPVHHQKPTCQQLYLFFQHFYQNFSASHFSMNGQLRTTWYFRKFFNMKGRYQDKLRGKRNINETKKKKAQILWLTF